MSSTRPDPDGRLEKGCAGLRFVWAVVAFVLAALMIGAGVAQRTVFGAPEAESIGVQTEGDAAYTLVDGDVLTMVPGSQTLSVEGRGPVFAAYGRTSDVVAWLDQTPYNHVTLGADGTSATTSLVQPDPSASPMPGASLIPTTTPAAPSDAQTGRSPVGSDLWLDEYQQDDELSTPLQLPSTMSVLVASDGSAPAPSVVTVTWPVDRSTPWAGPLIIGGGAVLAVGILLYLLGIRHARRSRGPRRKGLPLPVTEPIDLAVEGDDKGVISAGGRRRPLGSGTRALPGGRRRRFVVPALAVSGLMLAGCSSDAWPQFADSPTPSPSASVIVPEGQQAPAVTQAQAERILTRVSSTVADADTAMDATLAATRLTGAALAERTTDYAVRAKLPEHPLLDPLPDTPVEIVLPQSFDGWPRSFLAVVEGSSETTAPTIMTLTQENPWSEYKVSYVASLEASTNLPDLAAPYVGAVLAPPDSPFLLMQPSQVAAAYADVVDNAEKSPHWSSFDTADDRLLAGIRASRQKSLDALNQTGQDTATLSFTAAAGSQPPLALTTLDGGAIVALDVFETEKATPTNADAVIRLQDNPTVKAITGIDQSARGFTTTYLDQAFFYVPLQDSGQQIRLLGYRSNILDAKEIQ